MMYITNMITKKTFVEFEIIQDQSLEAILGP